MKWFSANPHNCYVLFAFPLPSSVKEISLLVISSELND
jgi:hypothetical protein